MIAKQQLTANLENIPMCHPEQYLEVLRGFDDGRLPEPGDLGPRAALHLADELGGAAVGRRLRRHLLDDARRERVLAALWLCLRDFNTLMCKST